MSFGGFDPGPGQPMAEINTTPLVDVMLVLLVIFIITAPLFHQAVAVDLPRVDAAKLEDKPRVIQIAIDGEGRLYWNGEAIMREALVARLAEAGPENPEVHLRADRGTRYEKVLEVMNVAQKAAITRIAFVTDSPGAGPAKR
ncbi:MAG: biopolymer transporter ExbD [Betaproteobacteria bacterium]|nr:biopolymer transporter ExbD [Betaproteobacteria bacterium]